MIHQKTDNFSMESRSSMHNVIIYYKEQGLLIIDNEHKFGMTGSKNVLSKWTSNTERLSKVGIDNEINIEGHAACKIVGVDDI